MGRVKQILHIPANKRCDSYATCKWKLNKTKLVRKQLTAAVQYCKDNDCSGYAALSSGKFPLIKDPRTINKRLDADIEEAKMYEDRQVLTVEQEKALVQYVINKNR